MVYDVVSHTKCPSNGRLMTADRRETMSSLILNRLDASKLVELLQRSGVEHLTTCRDFEARYFDSFITPDFRALYAYKCGQYRHCLQLSVRNVQALIVNKYRSCLFVPMSPELIQLMDDDIVSLIGLATLVDPSRNSDLSLLVLAHQLTLSLYLITRCQVKLRHPVTSLATTLHYVRLAHAHSGQAFRDVVQLLGVDAVCVSVDQHLSQFVEQTISRYVSVSR